MHHFKQKFWTHYIAIGFFKFHFTIFLKYVFNFAILLVLRLPQQLPWSWWTHMSSLQPLFNGSWIFPVGRYRLLKFSQPFSIWLKLSRITLKSSPPVTCDGPQHCDSLPMLWQPSDAVTAFWHCDSLPTLWQPSNNVTAFQRCNWI